MSLFWATKLSCNIFFVLLSLNWDIIYDFLFLINNLIHWDIHDSSLPLVISFIHHGSICMSFWHGHCHWNFRSLHTFEAFFLLLLWIHGMLSVFVCPHSFLMEELCMLREKLVKGSKQWKLFVQSKEIISDFSFTQTMQKGMLNDMYLAIISL